MYQWLCVLGIPGMLAGLVGFARAQMKQNRMMKLAVKAMLRDRLLQGYKHYMEKGWADLDDRANLENVWQQYHALGGNGDMNDLRRTFRHLPMTPGGPRTIVANDENNSERRN